MVVGLVEHNVSPPLIPALGGVLIVTVTVAEAAGQGATPFTV
jgi:hypothetical protein